MELEEAILSSDNPVMVIAGHNKNLDSDVVLRLLDQLSLKNQEFESDQINVVGSRQFSGRHNMRQTLSQVFIGLYRDHKLAENERRTILSHSSHLLVVQLCLMEYNKQKHDITEVDISEVILTSKKIIQHKLSFMRTSNQNASNATHPCESTNQEKDPRHSINIQQGCGSDGCESANKREEQSHMNIHQDSGSKSSRSSNEDAELTQLMDMYEAMLKRCNMVDLVDIAKKVGEWMEEERRKRAEVNKMNEIEMKLRKYIISQIPEDDIEKTMLEILSRDSMVEVLRIDTCDDSMSIDEGQLNGSVNVVSSEVKKLCDLSPADLAQVTSSSSLTPRTPTIRSSTEVFTRQLVFSHLALLINTRDEISLARCLSLPDKGMGIEGFTALRKAAQEKKMPMYQTMVSLIMKLRLGGKSYRPDLSSPLGAYIQPMGEFVDLLQNIQTLAEETKNALEAIQKVLLVIKKSILKSQGNVLRPASVEKVIEDINRESESLLSRWDRRDEKTPKKIIGQGRVIYGQRTINIIRSMVDHESGAFMSRICQTQMLSDTLMSQKTPVKLPSIVSQFRTPTVEADEDSPENTSLRERLRKSLGDSTDQSTDSLVHGGGAKSHMLWAEPTDTPKRRGANRDHSLQNDTANCRSKGLWADSPDIRPLPAEKDKIGGVRNKLHPSSGDSGSGDGKEGYSPSGEEERVGGTRTLSPDLIDSIVSTPSLKRHLAVESPVEAENEAEKETKRKNQTKRKSSKKRLVLSDANSDSQPATKKAKTNGPKQANGPKTKKKKEIPLAKGQKTLAHFFMA